MQKQLTVWYFKPYTVFGMAVPVDRIGSKKEGVAQMARVFRVFPVELRPGVTVEEFERFLKDVWVEVLPVPGVRSYVLKGDRGVEAGRYHMVVECDRAETRDLYWPTLQEESDLWKQLSEKGLSTPEAIRAEDQWTALVTPEWAEHFTDWVLVAE